MSENDPSAKKQVHQFFGLWAQDEETGKKAFVIRCPCGETIYYLEKDLFQEPDCIYPGMTIEEFRQMHKKAEKLRGLKRQIQRVALAQHAQTYSACPTIAKLKEMAGVSSIHEIPNPFHDLD